MEAAEREKLIAGDKFYIDKEFVQDKFCLFLDDVRITGSHEREVEKLLSPETDYQILYYAEYTGKGSSTIESYLNNNHIKSLVGLYPIIKNNEFVFNVRNIRVILTSEHFDEFIREMTDEFQVSLYDRCIGNHYHLVDVYKSNFSILKEIISPLI